MQTEDSLLSRLTSALSFVWCVNSPNEFLSAEEYPSAKISFRSSARPFLVSANFPCTGFPEVEEFIGNSSPVVIVAKQQEGRPRAAIATNTYGIMAVRGPAYAHGSKERGG